MVQVQAQSHSKGHLQAVPNLSIHFDTELKRKLKKCCMQDDPSASVDQESINMCGLVSGVGHEAPSKGQGERNHLDITVLPLSYDKFLFHTILILCTVMINTLNLILSPFPLNFGLNPLFALHSW